MGHAPTEEFSMPEERRNFSGPEKMAILGSRLQIWTAFQLPLGTSPVEVRTGEVPDEFEKLGAPFVHPLD
jgi:hypothetical protein